MKKYIPYAIAALAGFHLCWFAAYLGGWKGYSMNGADIIVSITCITMVWAVKGLLTQKKARKTNGHQPGRKNAGRK